jgi:hypothetical protein
MGDYDLRLVGLCRDMLRMHESTAIDLEQWDNAKEFVRRYIDLAIADIKAELAEVERKMESQVA